MPGVAAFLRLLELGPTGSGLDFSPGNALLNQLRGEQSAARQELTWADISALLHVHRRFWSAIPVAVFEKSTPDVRPYAREMAEKLLKSVDDEDVRRIAVLLKRLRRYWIDGRSASATVSRAELTAMLKEQKGRCRTCGYAFTRADLDARDFEEEPNAEQQIGDLRPPHVDHIIPLFLGGQAHQNLQVLCSKCNTGKGVAIAWPLKSAVLRPLRPSDLIQPNSSFRWMILARDRRCRKCTRGPLELKGDQRLIVVRKSEKWGWVLENAVAACTACEGQQPRE
jgi:5-methylcytosine-specific restriction endonuclease McrA